MIVRVRGTNTVNKGAELMLRSVVAALEGRHRVAVDFRAGSFADRAGLGVLSAVGERRTDLPLTLGERLLPRRFGQRLLDDYGIAVDRHVGAELDAAGFAYSDQFDLGRSAVAADRAATAHRSGRPYVLLPQAFGPFTTPELRAVVARLLDSSALVFARDRVSLEHLSAVGGRTDHVRLSPDFTCLLPGGLPPGFVAPEGLALVVPSAKPLTSRLPEEEREAYLPFLAAVVRRLRADGLDVHLLRHERNDQDVLDRLQPLLDRPAPVLTADSAVHLKGIVGAARAVVGSRFHALVSALSQGVPALGIGWSHKYRMLFEDYGCAEHVVPPTTGDDELASHLAVLSAGPAREALVGRLQAAAAHERESAEQMWRDVHQVLDDAA